MEVKDKLLENINLLHDRDELLEEGLVKAQGLETKAKTYEKNAKKTERSYARRRCCCWFIPITTVIVVLVGVFLILWLWLGVIKF